MLLLGVPKEDQLEIIQACFGAGGGGRRSQKEIMYMLPRDHRMQNELGVENMDDMVHLHEAAVLDNLRKRFEHDLIYTSTGPILIAMNPFKRLPIYANELMQATHAKLMSETPCEPHVFTTVGESYIAMRETGENQSMVICGESGAGKTETTKLMLRYLSRTASAVSGGGEIEEQILESNPVRDTQSTNLFCFVLTMPLFKVLVYSQKSYIYMFYFFPLSMDSFFFPL